MTHRQKLKIVNKLGLHLKAAAEFVRLSSRFKCRILVKRDKGLSADAKSLIGLINLAASYGTQLTFIAYGKDSPRALNAIRGLVSNRFGDRE